MSRILLVFTLGLSLLVAGASLAHGQSSIFVTNLNDTGAGSFRQAVASAFAGDTIKFTVTGTISLATPVSYGQSLVIWGPGTNLITLDGQGSTRQLQCTGGTTTIHGISIANSGDYLSNGGAFQFNGDTLHLDSVVFRDNEMVRWDGASRYRGGALYASCDAVHIRNSIFSRNRADVTFYGFGGTAYGGAVAAFCDVFTCEGSLFEKNGAIAERSGSSGTTAEG